MRPSHYRNSHPSQKCRKLLASVCRGPLLAQPMRRQLVRPASLLHRTAELQTNNALTNQSTLLCKGSLREGEVNSESPISLSPARRSPHASVIFSPHPPDYQSIDSLHCQGSTKEVAAEERRFNPIERNLNSRTKVNYRPMKDIGTIEMNFQDETAFSKLSLKAKA